MAQAKGGEEQDQIILLNDSASALEDSNPVLSKSLAQFADEKEKEWEDNKANNAASPSPLTDKDIPQAQARIKLLKAAALAVGPTYPLITQGLVKMANDMLMGMDEGDFLKIYPQNNWRDFRHEGPEDWLTYNEPLDDPFHEVITFYFNNEKLTSWKINDRPEVIKEYLGEFSFYQDPSIIYQAIKDVLLRMPYQDFLNVTNRQRPVIFTEFYSEGTARFASSSEFIVTKDDPACCSEGFTMVKLGMSLELATTPGPIEGVVAHEIAHRVLDSIRNGNVNCDAERAANALIKKWGFKEEFKEASQLFGQKKGDPAACQEVAHKASTK